MAGYTLKAEEMVGYTLKAEEMVGYMLKAGGDGWLHAEGWRRRWSATR